MVVVLPDPFGPMKPYTSPRSSLSDSRSTANKSLYFFVRSRHSIMVRFAHVFRVLSLVFRTGCWPLPDQLSSRRQTPNTKHKTLFDWQINPHPRFLPPRP